MKKEAALLILVFIFLCPLVEASFQLGNDSKIEEAYGPEDNIRGWLDISFSNEPSNNKITGSDDFKGSINLIDFLNLNLADYTCFPEDCEDDYSVNNGENSKVFSLSYNEEKIIGLKLKGNIKQIDSLKFDVSVSNPSSCINPLEIDILNDNDIEWKSKVIGNNFACKDKEGTGCFNSSEQLNDVRIGKTPFCEKISLPESNKFKLGAWVKKGTTTWYNGLLIMTLYDLYYTELVSCELSQPGGGSEISCEVEHENDKLQGYYVCIKAEDATDYIIKTESVDSCGFYAEPGDETEYHDYYIFARGAKYENIGSFTFDKDIYEEQTGLDNLADYLNSYIDWKYDKNCTDSCIIPIKFKAYVNLDINIFNLALGYSTGAGPSATPETKIYNTQRVAAKISSDFQKLDLEYSGITTPEDYGEYDLMLYLDNEELLDEKVEIEVKKIPVIKNVFPTIVPAAVPIKFIADVSSPAKKNIIEYRWSFGDDTNETTTNNSVVHIYDDVGDYSLSLEVEDTEGFTAKRTFKIKVESPKKIANSTIVKYKERLENLTSQISTMPEWYKKEIQKLIDIELLKEELKIIERDYSSASTSDEYIEIMTDLLDLEIPYSIKASSQGGLPFFINVDDIEPSYFEDLEAGSYDDEDRKGFQEAITGWSRDVLDLKLEFKYISAYYDNDIENLISVFNLKIDSKENLDELYVVIEEADVVFSRDYKVKEFVDGFSTGITLRDVMKDNVEFAVPYVNIEDIVIYLSPEFSQLEIERVEPCDFDGICEPEENENSKNCRSDCKPYGVALILFAVVLFVALIMYILLQWWYKTKYESHLFKKRNDLYNIVNFIKNAENQGMPDSEIRDKLKKAGWGGEQISYAFKKIRGRAILPFDFLKLFKRLERGKLETQIPRGYIPGRVVFR